MIYFLRPVGENQPVKIGYSTCFHRLHALEVRGLLIALAGAKVAEIAGDDGVEAE